MVLGPADVGPFAPSAFWPEGDSTGFAGLQEVAERALVERQPLAIRLPIEGLQAGLPPGAARYGLAFPIQFERQLHGVVALEVIARASETPQGALRQMQWGLAWLEVHLGRRGQGEGQAVAERLMTVLDLFATVLNQQRFEEAARALVTDLALKLNCDRVSLGLSRRGKVKVIAVSHSAEFGKRMNLINAIGTAMEEAIDQKSAVVHPLSEDGELLVTRDHERLARGHGSECIMTVPFSVGAEFVGALTLERPAHLPFDSATLELAQSLAAMLSHLLETKRLASRTLPRQFLDASRGSLQRMFGPRYVTRKLVGISIVLLVVFFSIASTEYRVSAPATIEGAVRRTLTAPFDGYIATAHQRAGDVVRAQTVLATLDDRDLRLERLRWASQYVQYARQFQEASASHDRAKSQIAQAQAEQARAQMSLIEELLARATVRAPFDAIIARGDLSQSLGGAVKRGETMFELTPLDAYRVVLQVDEGEITEIREGQRGTLVLASISDQPFEFSVRSVTPVTTSKEGRNFFRVEARLDQASDRLRPGMEGVGKVHIEERKLFWIWTHRLVNWFRLFLWTWLP